MVSHLDSVNKLRNVPFGLPLQNEPLSTVMKQKVQSEDWDMAASVHLLLREDFHLRQ